MKYNKAIALIVSSLGLFTSAYAEGWLCKPEGIVGFEYDKKTSRWEQMTYNDDVQYLIRRPPERRPYVWEVVVLGEEIPSYECWKELSENNFLDCGEFRFSRLSGKFTIASSWSYMRTDDQLKKVAQQPDSVGVAIGRCTAI